MVVQQGTQLNTVERASEDVADVVLRKTFVQAGSRNKRMTSLGNVTNLASASITNQRDRTESQSLGLNLIVDPK